MSQIQSTDLTVITERALERCKELAPGVTGRAEAVIKICNAYRDEDPGKLAEHFQLGDVPREQAEAIAWKALLTYRLEADLWAAGIGKVFGRCAQAAHAAHAQRHIMLNSIIGNAQQAEQVMLSCAQTAATIGNIITALLMENGVELQVPEEIQDQAKPAVLGPDGTPVSS